MNIYERKEPKIIFNWNQSELYMHFEQLRKIYITKTKKHIKRQRKNALNHLYSWLIEQNLNQINKNLKQMTMVISAVNRVRKSGAQTGNLPHFFSINVHFIS